MDLLFNDADRRSNQGLSDRAILKISREIRPNRIVERVKEEKV